MGTHKRAMEDRLHSAESAAELLGIRPSTIRWYWATGKLPRVKIGRFVESARECVVGACHAGKEGW